MADSDGMSRIIYIEPNDGLDYINDVPVTPDYSDLCIAFNLIVEIVPRFKTSAAQGQDTTEQYCIYWRSRAPIDGKQFSEGNYVSFLHGEKGFLTTYYTDTNYEDVVKKNIVEGLGIENVTVAYENYYTPTVTIKFVDQRGSSLFGREEATHNDDKLTIDNIFGAFFTAPYPKFKLQIKGFYGQAVTLQLTCSGFKGSLNSQTGNFEATATFIGYSYSLLTDIPFQYIVAAPYCDYVGRDYWAQNQNSPDWCFHDGSPMQTIYTFMDKVNASLSNSELLKLISDEDQEIIKNGETEKGEITDILITMERLKNSLELAVSNCFIENYTGSSIEDEQLLLFTDSDKIPETDDIRQSWETFNAKVSEYNENHGSNAIPRDSMPNEVPADAEALYEMRAIEVFNLEFRGENEVLTVTFSDGTGTTSNESELKSHLKLNTNSNGKQRELSESTAKILATHLAPGEVTGIIKTHAYLVDFHDIRKRLNDRAVYIDDETNHIEQTTERNYIELAKSNLQMVPYIGNIFKMIMAHIDTFVHIMYSCYERIESQRQSGGRLPGYLNIKNLSKTDIPLKNGQKDIPAWPLITKASVAEKSEYVTQEEDSNIGWVGDIAPGKFEEEKLVRALFLACKKTGGDEFKNKEQETNVNYVPITPSDINLIGNAFQGNKETTISTLAGMLGLRTAQIFGVMEKASIDNGTAKIMGRMDAYNYYLQNFSKSEINRNIIEACGNKSLANKLRDIMLCKKEEDCMADTHQNDKQSHPFERKPGVITSTDRHPIYSESGSTMKYVHYYTKNHYGLVPSVIQTFGIYDNRYIYRHNGGNPYFDYVHNNNRIPDTLVNCTAKALHDELDDGKRFELNKYTNTEMFNVEMDRSKVDGILRRYEELKSKNFKILGEQYEDDFTKVLDRYWHVSDSDYSKWVDWKSNLLTPKYADLGIDPNNPKDGDSEKIENTDVSYNRDGEWGDGKTVDSLFVDCPYISVVKDNKDFESCSLFASYFYYMQNTIEDKSVRNKVKALFILHSLNNGLAEKVTPLSFSNKNCGCIEVANPSYMLLLGGLLWRKRYYEEKNADPVVYSMANFNYAYQKPSHTTTFFYDNGKRRRFCSIIEKGKVSYNVSVKSLFNGLDMDYHVENILIQNFESFVNSECQTIINKLELKSVDGKMVSPELIFKFWEELTSYDKEKGARMQEGWADRKKMASKNFAGFFDNYIYYVARKYRDVPFILFIKDDNSRLQDILKWLFAGKCIIIDTPARIQTKTSATGTRTPQNGTDVSVQSSNLDAYLEGFSDVLKKIVGTVTETAIDNSDQSSAEYGDIAEFDRDVAIPIYMYLKMVWDKWLVASDKLSPYDNEYTVGNFFKNFVFIDSFYRNITNRFMMNCGILLRRYTENHVGTKDYAVFKYIGDITTDHNCLFLAVPDFIEGMGMNDESKEKARDALSSIFVPVPYEKMRDMDLNNKFVIIYVPKLSETPSEINGFSEDGFNIWSYNEKDGVCPPIFKATRANTDELSGYGYFVPSFGLAYGRQHNHLFKNISLNMETPIITSAVINTMSHIIRMGASNQHAIAYVGQDIYPVFSNYSYICEFEMMGCAQIQPLMYFQLMNVPMWRGTYMIFNVVHTMTPGNMVTRVKAMKLSCRAVPYSNAWFKKNMNYNPDDKTSGADCGEVGGSTGSATDWVDAIKKMGNWYANNVHTYQGKANNRVSGGKRTYYNCSLVNGKVADDCSGLVSACLKFYKIEVGDVHTASMQPGSKFDKTLRANGFQYLPFKRESLKAGDIMCSGPDGHTSICGGMVNGKLRFYDWGNTRDNAHGGLPCGYVENKSHPYKHIWRKV